MKYSDKLHLLMQTFTAMRILQPFSNLHNTIMQSVLGGSLHKNNTSYLLLGLDHASVNRISIVLMQIIPQDEWYYGICASSKYPINSSDF